MKLSISGRYSFRFVLVLMLAMSVVTVIVASKLISASARKGVSLARGSSPPRVDAAIAQTAADQKAAPLAPAIPILLKPHGFVPKEISKPAGPYYFAVGNLSGVPEVALRLAQEHGGKLKEVNARKERPWKEIVKLTPGTYLITEANHPDWVCRITVTPR